MKKLISLFLSVSVLLLAACSKQPDTASTEQKANAGGLQTVVVASTGSDADIWRYIATLPETKAAGIKLEVKNFTDYVAMNTAVANKEVALYTTNFTEPLSYQGSAFLKLPKFP